MGIKIDLGCGPLTRPGFIGIDSYDYGQAIVRDFRKGLPFHDNTVSHVNMSHFLEHVHGGEDLYFLLSEIWRVCYHGAQISIRVPHSDSPQAHDPFHVSFWNEHSFSLFDADANPLRVKTQGNYWNFKLFRNPERQDSELHIEFLVWKPEVHMESNESRKTSIIIVHYGDIWHTRRMIESILRWTDNANYEIIVVDNDFKEDEIPEYYEAFVKKHEQIKWITPNENLGWIKGINRGIQEIDEDSQYVIFANNDVVITGPGWLNRLLNHFSENVGAVGPTSNYVIGRQAAIYNHQGIYEEDTNFLIGFFMCIRKDIVDKIGGLDERFGIGGADDYDYSIRIKELGYRLLIARDVYIHHSGSKSFMPLLGVDGYNDFWKQKNKELEDKWGEGTVNKLHLPNLHVACCIPMRTDYLHRLFALRLANMEKPFGWTVVDIPRGLIHDSRNKAVEHALKIGAHYVMFIDDDMVPRPDLFIRLFNHQVPVVSALAFKRRKPYEPCIYSWAFDPNHNSGNGGIAVVPLHHYVKRGIQRVEATGFGAILIRTDVFEKIPRPWFQIDQFGEDIDFSLKCHDNDIPIYCDTDLVIQHIGDCELVDEDTYERFKQSGEQGTMILEEHGPEKVKTRLIENK